jgi:hypothetical protein
MSNEGIRRTRTALAVAVLLALPATARAIVSCSGAGTYAVPGTYISIIAAVAALPATLTEPVCITVNDSNTYIGQVEVRNFINNGSSITIQAAPGFFPVVRSIVTDTAGFLIANASVNVFGIDVRTEMSIPYGIWASSAYVQISSVAVYTFGAGDVTAAGIRISSWSAISYSTVTVGNAHGYWLDGSTKTSISHSSATNQSATSHAVYLNAANNNDFTVLFASNSHLSGTGFYAFNSDTNTVTQSLLWGGGEGLFLDAVSVGGSAYNAISLSTLAASMLGGQGFYAAQSDSNTVTGCSLSNPAGYAAYLSNANYNTIEASSLVNNAPSYPAFGFFGSKFNSVVRSSVTNPVGPGMALSGISTTHNEIKQSTITCGSTLYGLWFDGASSNTVADSHIQCLSGEAVRFESGAKNNEISFSTMISNIAAGYALYSNSSSSNSVTSSYMQNLLGDAVWLVSNSNYNDFSLSTMVSNVADRGAFRATNSDSNTVTDCWMLNQAGHAAWLDILADYNAVSQSTMISGALNQYGLYVLGASNTISGSYIHGSTAAFIFGSTSTVIRSSVLRAQFPSGFALSLGGGSVNLTVSSSVLNSGNQGTGAYVSGFNNGLIEFSSNTIGPNSKYGIYVFSQMAGTEVWLTSNTILPAVTVGGFDTYGIYMRGVTTGATIQNNNMYFRATGAGTMTVYPFYFQNSAALLIERNRVSNPGIITGGSLTAFHFDDTDSSVIRFNDVFVSGAGMSSLYFLRAVANSNGLTVRNNIFSSSATASFEQYAVSVDFTSQAGFSANFNDYHSTGSLNLSWMGGSQNLANWRSVSLQDINSISADPLWANMTAGSEDFHLKTRALDGRYNPATSIFELEDSVTSPAIDRADPAASYFNEPVRNGLRANLGSYGNTLEASKTPRRLKVINIR